MCGEVEKLSQKELRDNVFTMEIRKDSRISNISYTSKNWNEILITRYELSQKNSWILCTLRINRIKVVAHKKRKDLNENYLRQYRHTIDTYNICL